VKNAIGGYNDVNLWADADAELKDVLIVMKNGQMCRLLSSSKTVNWNTSVKWPLLTGLL